MVGGSNPKIECGVDGMQSGFELALSNPGQTCRSGQTEGSPAAMPKADISDRLSLVDRVVFEMTKGGEELFYVTGAENGDEYSHHCEDAEGEDKDDLPEQDPGHRRYSVIGVRDAIPQCLGQGYPFR